MDGIKNFIRGISNALEADSDGGAVITSSEIKELKAKCPNVAEALVDQLGALINEKEADGSHLSQADINELRKGFPKLADSFVRQMHHHCLWPSSVKLFAPDASNSGDSCMDRLGEEARYVREKLGFTEGREELVEELQNLPRYQIPIVAFTRSQEFADFVSKLRESYPTSKGFGLLKFSDARQIFKEERVRENIFDKDFVDFAHLLKSSYKTDLFSDPSSVLDIYQSPQTITLLRNTETARIFKRLDGLFNFAAGTPLRLDIIPNNSSDPMILDALMSHTNIDARIDAAKALYDKLKKIYGATGLNVDNLSHVKSLFSLLDDPAQAKKLLTPAVAEAYRIASKEYGLKINVLNERQRWQIMHLADNAPLIAFLRKEKGKLLVGESDYVDKKGLCIVASLDDLERIKKIMERKDGRDILFLSGRYDQGSLSDAQDMLRYGDDLDARALAARMSKMAKRLPRILFRTEDFNRINSNLFADYAYEQTVKIYNLLATAVPRGPIDIKEFTKIATAPDAMKLLADKGFLKDCLAAAALLGDEGHMAEAIGDCIKTGRRGINRILSPKGRKAVAILKNLYSVTSLTANFEIFASLLKRDDLPLFLKALENAKIVGHGNLFRGGSYISENLGFPNMGEISKILTVPKIVKALWALSNANVFSNLRLSLHLLDILDIVDKPDKVESLLRLRVLLNGPINGDTLYSSRTERENLDRFMPGGDLHGLLANKAFKKLCVLVRGEFLNDKSLSLDDLIAIAEVFPDADVVSSEQFKRIKTMLADDFHITKFTTDMLRPIVLLAKTLDFKGMDNILKRLGRRTSSNDVFLLNVVAKTPAIRRLLFDRRALLAEAKIIYKSEPLFRKKLDFSSVNYTERPPLDKMDSLALLRLVLLARALKDEKIRAQLGDVVCRDIVDKNTEYGGQVLWNGSGVYFNHVRSISRENGSYGNALNQFFDGGVMNFHLHALEHDNSEYAGPSGNPFGTDGGDWTVSRLLRSTDIVVTTAGFVDKTEKELWVNLDMYYIDDKGQPFVIDLGKHRVPCTPPRNHP